MEVALACAARLLTSGPVLGALFGSQNMVSQGKKHVIFYVFSSFFVIFSVGQEASEFCRSTLWGCRDKFGGFKSFAVIDPSVLGCKIPLQAKAGQDYF